METSRTNSSKNPAMPLGDPLSYPVGSPESRAAARAMLEAQSPSLTQREQDLVTLYGFIRSGRINYSNDPPSGTMSETPQYQEGRAIALRLEPDREIFDRVKHEREATQRWYKYAAIRFYVLHRREPKKGDRMTFDEFCISNKVCHIIDLRHTQEAWDRQIKEYIFPFRIHSDGTIWRRVRRNPNDSYQVMDEFGAWVKDEPHSRRFSLVDEHACAWCLMQKTVIGQESIDTSAAKLIAEICFGDGRLMAPKRRGQQTV